MTSPDQLVVKTDRAADTVTVRVAGEVDLATAPQLEAEVFAACGAVAAAGLVVVDLTEVEFLSSVGLTVLVAAHERCTTAGARLRVVAGPVALRPLQVTALDQVLDVSTAASDPARRAG